MLKAIEIEQDLPDR